MTCKKPATWKLSLRFLGKPADEVQAMRRMLKCMLRGFDFRCTRIEDLGHEPPHVPGFDASKDEPTF